MAFDLQSFALWVLIATVILTTDRCTAIRKVPIEEDSSNVEVSTKDSLDPEDRYIKVTDDMIRFCCNYGLELCCKMPSGANMEAHDAYQLMSAFIERKQRDGAVAASSRSNPTDGHSAYMRSNPSDETDVEEVQHVKRPSQVLSAYVVRKQPNGASATYSQSNPTDVSDDAVDTYMQSNPIDGIEVMN